MLEMAGKEISRQGRKSEGKKELIARWFEGVFDVELQQEGQNEDQILAPYFKVLETLHVC